MSAEKQRNTEFSLPPYAIKQHRSKAKTIGLRARVKNYSLSKKQALICPPTSPGSLGDEAMLQALVRQLKNRGFTIDLLVSSKDEDWSSIDDVRGKIELGDLYQMESIMNKLAQYRAFYLLGADVLDAYYSEPLTQQLLWLSYLASKCCSKVTVAGFSFNNNPAKGCIKMFSILPRKVRICIRDRSSLERFNKYVGKKAILVADLAFLLAPDKSYSDSPNVKWINNVRKQGGKLLGLNISAHSFNDLQVKNQKLVNHYKKEIEKILKTDQTISILLLPHDIRGPSSDVNLLKDVQSKISGNFSKRVRLVEVPITATAVKFLVGHVDVMISGRMHIAIACLGMATPVACVTYQYKFEGLYRFFGFEKSLTMKPEQALKQGVIADVVKQLFDHQNSLKKTILLHQPAVNRLAMKNLA